MKISGTNVKNFLVGNKVLILILLISFSASLFYSFHFKIKPAVDARAYDNIASNIAAGNGYREDLGTDLAHDYAIARVGPFYEYFLAGIYKIFGHSYAMVWIFQALLHVLSAWLIYLVSLLIFQDTPWRKQAALVAAAIVGFYPDLIEISAMLMSETLYLFFICLSLYVFFRFLRQPGFGLAVGLGLVFGLAVLARPPVLFLLPVILFYFWQKKIWRPALLFLVTLSLVFIPWTVRNYQVYGQLMPFGAAGNYNFWIGNWHGSNGEQEPQPFQVAFASTHETKDINAESMRQFEKFVLQYPAEFLKLTVWRASKYFSVIRPMGFWFYQHGLGQALFIFSSAVASVILFVLGFGGMVKTIIKRDKQLYYLLALTIFTPLILFITVVETRYRFQIYPLLAVFAGYFSVGLFGQGNWRKNRILWIVLAIFAANGLLDLLLSLDRFKEKIAGFF